MAWEAKSVPAMLPCRYGEDPAAEAQALVEDGASALMSWGSAAGLIEGLPAGRLLLPQRVIDRQGQTWWPCPDRVLPGLATGLMAERGWLAEADRVLADPGDKRALAQSTGAVAADMESAAILRVADQAGLPCVVVRVVLDTLTDTVPGVWQGAVDRQGRVRPVGVIRALAQPGAWAAGARLAWARARARRALEAAARQWDPERQAFGG
jgi:hypothetical protein